ncbi:MAG: HEPN domain-containing protein [Methyloligellaceae bacterium]
MSKPSSISENDFINITKNFRELEATLKKIGVPAEKLVEEAFKISACWLRLAEEHLNEAAILQTKQCERAVYSRSYYAVYNASKSLRYIVYGKTSLRADDHQKASDLPDDLPDAANWSQKINILYEHRLRADYDNWTDTKTQNSLTADDALKLAKEFINIVKKYILDKFEVEL